MVHSFNVQLAVKYGVEAAVLIHNIAFWILKNKANKVNIKAGEVWTYNSSAAFSELLPYMSAKSIQRTLYKLEHTHSILKSNNRLSEKAGDRTKWYTIVDKEIKDLYSIGTIGQKCPIQRTKMSNALDKNVQSIYKATDNKPDKKTNKDFLPKIEKKEGKSTKNDLHQRIQQALKNKN